MLSNILKILVLNLVLRLSFCRILDKNLLNELGYNTDSVLIDLSKKSIESIEKNTFQGYNKLEIIYLQDNKLLRLDNESFKYLVNLKELWLEDNSLIDIDLNTFRELYNLQKVCLFNNPISALFPSILNNLCILNIKCNIIYTDKCIGIRTTFTTTKLTTTTTRSTNLTSKNFAKINIPEY